MKRPSGRNYDELRKIEIDIKNTLKLLENI